MCIFDLCEFYNLLIGGLIGAVIGLIMVRWYERRAAKRQALDRKKMFKPLESKDENTFDWICYNIQGREQSVENGSTANLRYIEGNKLEIRVKETGGSIWVGQITMLDNTRGSLTFTYPGKYEYGFKECYLGQEKIDDKTFDYWILVGDGLSYFNELVRRARD